MREAPMKTAAFRQGITSVSKIQKERIGCLRILEDGRKFRYAKSAAVITPGQGTAAKVIAAADHITCDVGNFNASRTQLTVTFLGTGTAIAANGLAGGYLMVESGTGVGRSYRIVSNTYASASDTTTIVTLADRMAASSVTTKVALVHNPWMDVVISDNLLQFTGAALVTLAVGDYFWAQTGGPGVALIKDTPAVGAPLSCSATNGSFGVAVDTTASNALVIVATIWGTVGVDAKCKPVIFCAD